MITPLLLGSWADLYDLSEVQIGLLASLELGCMALVSLASSTWIDRTDPRMAYLICLPVIAAGDYFSFELSGVVALFVLRALLGVFAGVVAALGTAMLARATDPTRVYGFNIGAQFFYGFVVFLALPPLMAEAGPRPLALTVAGTSLFAALFVGWLPRTRLERDPALKAGPMPLAATAILLATVVFFVVQLGLWAFAERMGGAFGFDPVVIGRALAATSFFGGFLAIGVGTVERRIGTKIPLLVACAMEITGLVLVFERPSYAMYATGLTLFSMGWAMTPPLLFGLLARVTRDSAVTGLMPAAQTTGMALGPFVFGFTILPGDYRLMIGSAIVLLVIFAIVMIRFAITPRAAVAAS